MKKVAFQLPISVILFIAVCNFIARNEKRKQQRWVFINCTCTHFFIQFKVCMYVYILLDYSVKPSCVKIYCDLYLLTNMGYFTEVYMYL